MRLNVPFVKALIENYAANHWSLINDSCTSLQDNASYPDVQDARSVWFSLADIKKFICDFEKVADESQLGVRIYYGEYSADMVNSFNVDPQCVGLHTVLMVPTLLGADGYNHDFDPVTKSSDFSQSTTVYAMNHGTMAPPPFTSSTNTQVKNVGQDLMLFCDGDNS